MAAKAIPVADGANGKEVGQWRREKSEKSDT